MRLYDPVSVTIDWNEFEKGDIGVISKIIDGQYVEVLIHRPRNYFFDEYDFIEKINVKYLQPRSIDDHDLEYEYYFKINGIKVVRAIYVEISFRSTERCAEEFYRKPTKEERREIVINYIKKFSGEFIKVKSIAKLLGVKERTIQYLLNNLENAGIISRTKPEVGMRKVGYKIEYIKDDIEIKPSDITIEALYDIDNPAGTRDYDWDDFKVVPYAYDDNFNKQDAAYQLDMLEEWQDSLVRKRKEYRNRR